MMRAALLWSQYEKYMMGVAREALRDPSTRGELAEMSAAELSEFISEMGAGGATASEHDDLADALEELVGDDLWDSREYKAIERKVKTFLQKGAKA